MAASTIAAVGMTHAPSCRISRSPASVQQPVARFVSMRPRVCQPRQRCGPTSSQGFNQGFKSQYGPFTFQGGWGGPAMNGGDYQAAARNWANVIKEMEKAFEASGGRARPGMFNNWRDMAGAVESAMGTLALPVDLEEEEEAFILRADVPGMEKSDLKIKVNAQDRTLTISGERRRPSREVVPEVNGDAVSTEGGETAEGESEPIKGTKAEEPKEEEPKRKQRYERRMGKFERTFTLSEKADVEAVSARVEKGVLTLRVGKVPETRPDIRDVFIY